ncbi:hypothetical protein [Marinigracilibium pacificum]|uniref:Uncharacterized protein n=1 Tax=Marinigracilibium pacificum TaxID=2729599 RepID=A0A848JA34_9BACT|nr:hypothetical protein [Marinigracilibium pacificum]NMM49902.1 hypothetical protein [Marinigracilibium pacificum]
MITKAIIKAFDNAKKKNWDKTFWAFDIHETIIKPNWSADEIPTEFYPRAKEAMQMITHRSDVTSILFTCSHPHEISKYLAYFEQNGIHFDHVNENPEVKSKKYGYYEKKPYFNVLFEDKAGFDPNSDWDQVIELLSKN